MYPILILKNVLYILDKELDETEIVLRGDMELTIGQIIGARNGTRFSKKWPEGKVPYTFHESLLEQERNVLEKIFKRFNKDLKGCLQVRYIFNIHCSTVNIKQKKFELTSETNNSNSKSHKQFKTSCFVLKHPVVHTLMTKIAIIHF